MNEKPTGGHPALELRRLLGVSALGSVSETTPISLTLSPGQVGVLLGGKETAGLFRMIMGMGTLAAGEILVNGEVLGSPRHNQTQLARLRQRIGFAFRDKGLLSNLTLHENVDLPAKYHGFYAKGQRRGAVADQALEELRIAPDVWHVRPNRISGELRKRVLFARSIVLNPAVVILDDPTTLLDSPYVPQLMQWIARRQAMGTAMLIGTGDLPFGLAVADWIMHPKKFVPVRDYSDFVEPTWIASAALLKPLGRLA